MIPILQKLTIIMLVLLQFTAPLVHAHSGMQNTGLGLHVPGLESWSVGTDIDAMSSSTSQLPWDNCLVSVGTAIQQNPLLAAESSSDYALLPADKIFSIALDARLINFSPHLTPFIPSTRPLSYDTRAPPFSS